MIDEKKDFCEIEDSITAIQKMIYDQREVLFPLRESEEYESIEICINKEGKVITEKRVETQIREEILEVGMILVESFFEASLLNLKVNELIRITVSKLREENSN